jgi:hypothetical protein
MAASGLTQKTPRPPSEARGRAFTRGMPRGLRLLLCFLGAMMLLASRPAAAMVLAPMCGGHGETLIAPPITRNAKDYPLAPSACDRKNDSLLESHAPNPAPPSAPAVEIVPRLPPVRYGFPSTPCVLVPIESAVSGERPGHGRGIERPPRQ